MTNRVRLTQDYRGWPAGTVFDRWAADGLNFYALGVVDDYVPGITGNYLTIPRYAGVVTDGRSGGST